MLYEKEVPAIQLMWDLFVPATRATSARDPLRPRMPRGGNGHQLQSSAVNVNFIAKFITNVRWTLIYVISFTNFEVFVLHLKQRRKQLFVTEAQLDGRVLYITDRADEIIWKRGLQN